MVLHTQAAGVESFHANPYLVARRVVPEEASGAQVGWTLEVLTIAEAQVDLPLTAPGSGGMGLSVVTFNHHSF